MNDEILIYPELIEGNKHIPIYYGTIEKTNIQALFSMSADIDFKLKKVLLNKKYKCLL
jgi:hypothetical protein